MDFRWNSAKLFGVNTVHNNDVATCPIENSVGDVGTTTPTDVDKMWKHAPASCDSTVTREDVDGTGIVSKLSKNLTNNTRVCSPGVNIDYKIADLKKRYDYHNQIIHVPG